MTGEMTAPCPAVAAAFSTPKDAGTALLCARPRTHRVAGMTTARKTTSETISLQRRLAEVV